MKPCRFRYCRPESVEEAVELLARYGEEAKVLAGGQSLVPMMNMRLARPAVLVDINRIVSLDHFSESGGELIVGALSRQSSMVENPLAARHVPVLPAVAEWMSHPQIRNRGTIVGSIVHADPAAELPAVALVLEAGIDAVSARGERRIPASEFYLGYYATELGPEELASRVLLPRMHEQAGWSVHEVCRRRGDFAIAGMVTMVRLDANARVEDVRMAAFGFGGRAFRLPEIEADLTGQGLSDELLEHAGVRTAELVPADDDIHATARYRRALAGEVARRTLAEAAAMAAGKRAGGRQ